MAKIVIFGIGQLAETIHSYLVHDSPHEIAAFTVDGAFLDRTEHMGLPVVDFGRVEELYPPGEFSMIIAVSYRSMNRIRALKCAEAKEKGYTLISYVSSRAIVSPDVTMGDNCFICEHNVIQPLVRLGHDVFMGDGNHVGHHTQIEDHCFITSHVVVSGSVRVGHHSFLGVNSTIRDRITIGAESVIGAGALILRDVPERSVFVGVPGRRLPQDSSTLEDL